MGRRGRINWDAQPLGAEPDGRIAARLGVTTSAARAARARRGIPPAPATTWREPPSRAKPAPVVVPLRRRRTSPLALWLMGEGDVVLPPERGRGTQALRQLQLLRIVARHGRVSIDHLVELLGTQRTVYRDVEQLIAIGAPLALSDGWVVQE